jgi:hypothetical protein
VAHFLEGSRTIKPTTRSGQGNRCRATFATERVPRPCWTSSNPGGCPSRRRSHNGYELAHLSFNHGPSFGFIESSGLITAQFSPGKPE